MKTKKDLKFVKCYDAPYATATIILYECPETNEYFLFTAFTDEVPDVKDVFYDTSAFAKVEIDSNLKVTTPMSRLIRQKEYYTHSTRSIKELLLVHDLDYKLA